MLGRRRFLASLSSAALGATLLPGVTRRLASQAPRRVQGASNAPMDQQAYRAVRLPPKEPGRPSMSVAQRDELEHHIHCQCGCNLDVYTCRTTDFSCGVSPAMHDDIVHLVEGGHSADEIVAAFSSVYGEQVLMAPRSEGLNWVGYLLPGAVVGAGAVVVTRMLHRWQRPGAMPAAGPVAPPDATAEEVARLDAALRDDRP